MVRERGASTARREQRPCPIRRRCRYGVRVLPRRQASPQRSGQAASSVWANAASREDAVRRFSLQQLGWISPGNGGDLVHLSRLLPRLGQDQEGWQSGAASDGEEPLRPRPGGGHRLVPDQPASADQGSARPSERDDARSYAYYGVSGNYRRLSWYANEVASIWKKWLSRRDRRKRFLWSRFSDLLKRYPLPAARIVHRYTTMSEARP